MLFRSVKRNLCRSRSIGPGVEAQVDAVANLERVLAAIGPPPLARGSSAWSSVVHLCTLVPAAEIENANGSCARDILVAASVVPDIDGCLSTLAVVLGEGDELEAQGSGRESKESENVAELHGFV